MLGYSYFFRLVSKIATVNDTQTLGNICRLKYDTDSDCENRLQRKRTFPPFTIYQISVDVDEPASLTVSEGAALSMVEVEVWLSARGLDRHRNL